MLRTIIPSAASATSGYNPAMNSPLFPHLEFLYGAARAPELRTRAETILTKYRALIQARDAGLTERDAILITYGDQVQAPGEKPLRTLAAFCEDQLKDIVSGIHILPFYPWSSDDGFSVLDYRAVDPGLGDWQDIAALQPHFRLMFDGVINHISAGSAWFEGFLRGDPRYRAYFIVVDGAPDLAQVVRPRALPLLTAFQTHSGAQQVWTTFSADQVDLNYQNPEVLLEILDILLMYAQRGADFIRLDAIAYLWKQIGTTCLHLPQTHRVIQFLRAALDEVAPQVHLITETNVPHTENLSYFGDGANEAQLVYNFALPPLILHTFQTGDARALSAWAHSLALPSGRTTFFNFLASHDGIGINPARGILSEAEIAALVSRVLEHGGLVSYKNNPDGSTSPYELNINYFDALSNPHDLRPGHPGAESLDVQVSRFMAAQACMLALLGVPGIYFHSLFGSRGWRAGVQQSGMNRTINRQKCSLAELQSELASQNSIRSKVFGQYRQLLNMRRSSPAFHPHGAQTILDVHPSVFALERIAPGGESHMICMHNVSQKRVTFTYPSATGPRASHNLTGTKMTLDPYQISWIKQ